LDLTRQFSNPFLRAFISTRLDCSPANLDEAVENLLQKDTEEEFTAAVADVSNFSLKALKNSTAIEGALSDYVLAMALSAVYRAINSGKFLFDQFTSGLLIENIVDAVVRTRLMKEYSYRLIDTRGIDFAISRKNGVMLAGVQCKALIDAGKGVLGARSLLAKLHKSSKHFKKLFDDVNNAKFAVFCGYLYFSSSRYANAEERKTEREKILHQFKTEGWPVFLVFRDQQTYEIDNSVVEFVRLIESL